MDDDSYTFQLLDVRIEDNIPKSLEYEDITELLGDSFSEALNASKYSGKKKNCNVFLFGRTDTGKSITVHVHGFRPFLFFRKNEFESKHQLINEIVDEVNRQETKYFNHIKATDLEIETVSVKHAYGYEPNEDNTDRKTFEYYKVYFVNKKSWNAIAKKDNESNISQKAHEKNVDIITRFFNETNISPLWITVSAEAVYEKVSTSTIEVECSYKCVSQSKKSGFAKIRIGYWDIETFGLETSTPICTIGLTVKTYGETRVKYVLQVGVTSDIDGRIVISCQNEKDLIYKFRDLILELDLDGLVTYNGTNFDEEFVIERATILEVDQFFYCSRFAFRKCFKKKIPLSSSGMGDNELTIFDTPGIIHCDWFIKFKMEDKEPSYKLNYYGEKYCGGGKDDVKYWEIPGLANGSPEDRARLAKYCGIDCDLLDDLEGIRNIFSDMFNLAAVCLILPQWVYFKGQQVRYISQLLCKARKKNMILNVPEMGWSGDKHSSYEGAIVFDPIVGYYEDEPVSVLDFMSLYPSIIMSHNFSPDTLVQKQEFKELEGVVSHEISGKENVVYHFTTKVKGLLPEMLEDLMAARKQTKKEMKIAQQKLESETDPEIIKELKQEIKNLDGKQKAQKISANSLYGAMGAFSTGTYICLAAAESTTNMARQMLVETKEFLEANYDCTVVYGDTDSCMVKFNGVTDLQESGKMAMEAANKMTTNYKTSGYPCKVLEYEDTLYPCLFLAKKRYIGYKYVEGKDGTIIPEGIYCKGVETERRDFCKFAKDVYTNIIDGLIVQRNLEKTLKQFDNDMKSLINKKVPFEDFILNKSLSKDYKTPENQPHLQVNEKKKKRNPGSENSIGERVDFVIIEGPPNSKMAELAEDPEYVKDNSLKLDYEWYCAHQVQEPITRLLGPIKNIPNDLFKRYIGELKRVRLNISSLESFTSEIDHETVFMPRIKNNVPDKTEKKRKSPPQKQMSIFDFGTSSNDKEENIKVPKFSSSENNNYSKKRVKTKNKK